MSSIDATGSFSSSPSFPMRIVEEDGEAIGRVGLGWSCRQCRLSSCASLNAARSEALGASLVRTGDLTVFTLKSIKKMVQA